MAMTQTSRIFVSIVFSGVFISAAALASDFSVQLPRTLQPLNVAEGRAVASRCIEPIKPLKSLKPYWCQGDWVQVLECDQYCHCSWIERCIE